MCHELSGAGMEETRGASVEVGRPNGILTIRFAALPPRHFNSANGQRWERD